MTTEAPTKPAATASNVTGLIMPEFGSIPLADMAKAKQYKQPSKAKQELNAKYDAFVLGIPAGRAGVVKLVPGLGARTVMGLIRGSIKRTGVTRVRMQHNAEKNQVELEVSKEAAKE